MFPRVFGDAASSPLGLALEGVSSTRPIGSNWSSVILF